MAKTRQPPATTASQPPGGAARIEALTGLRFVAAAVVAIEHFPRIVPGNIAPERLAQGGAGVTLFFVLSGFVLVFAYDERFRDGIERSEATRFGWARVARIMPLHLLALAVVAVIVLGRGELVARNGPVAAAVSLAANTVLVHAWIPTLPMRSWNGPAWSISAEAFFYLCFPLLFQWVVQPIRRRRWEGRALVTVAVAHMTAFTVVSWLVGTFLLARIGDPETTRLVVFRLANVPALRIGEFLCGCLLGAAYTASSRPTTGGWATLTTARSRTALFGAAVVVALGLQWTPTCLGGACGADASDPADFVDLRTVVIYVPIAIAMIAAMAWGDSPIARLLARPTMVRLGEISYGFYLFQWTAWLLINRRGEEPPDRLTSWLAVLITLAVAAITYRLVEQPARRWILQRTDPTRPITPR